MATKKSKGSSASNLEEQFLGGPLTSGVVRNPRNWLMVFGILCAIVAIVVASVLSIDALLVSMSAPSSITFHFTNNSAVRIDSFAVTIPSGDIEVGPIAPGQSRDVKATAEHNFDYKYRAKATDHLLTGIIANWNDDDAQGPWRQHDISIDPSPGGGVKVGPDIGH